jgi:uncharacterized protein
VINGWHDLNFRNFEKIIERITMNQRFLLLLLIILQGFLTAQNSELSGISRRQYFKEFRNERSAKDKEFADTSQSPLSYEQIAHFSGLKYYRINPKYKVKAIFRKIDSPVTFKMKTTTERQPIYSTYATISFSLLDTTIILNVYQNIELTKKPGFADYLFVPFTDQTSSGKSYGGGRYLDLHIPKSDTIEVDFNKAYNPYCAYNHKYSCPIPPAENYIPMKIEAGEKKYK